MQRSRAHVRHPVVVGTTTDPTPPLAEDLDPEAAGEDIDDDEDADEDADEEEEEDNSPETDRMEPFDATGLREIGNLASWTVSTAKPGCGVEALRDEDTNLFWQSDGPQPHLLNIHFIRMVSITNIRIYLDFTLDESYTPTRITFLGGTSHHDLIEFAELAFENPKGWIDVDLTGVGGGPDGNTLRAHLVQIKITENHQNGKDTHVRGLQIYARDEGARARGENRQAPAQQHQNGGGGYMNDMLELAGMLEPMLR